MTDGYFGPEAQRPRPAPSAASEPWIEPDAQVPRWTPEGDVLGAVDASGRHTVPEDQTAAAQPTSSYGQFMADPPYVAEHDSSLADAGAMVTLGAAVGGGGHPTVTAANPVHPTPMTGDLWQPLDAGPRDQVTCPECGATQEVHLNRRDAVDFCRRCDFPLFWTPSRVTRDRDLGPESEALRRLPGTVGRDLLASFACPHCAELNVVAAENCIRCGLSMHPVAPPPPPPVVVAPPPPVVVEPERGVPWWVWLLLALATAAIVVLVVLKATGVV